MFKTSDDTAGPLFVVPFVLTRRTTYKSFRSLGMKNLTTTLTPPSPPTPFALSQTPCKTAQLYFTAMEWKDF